MNRLTHAAYTGDGNYTANYSYDNMGNITSLKRYDVSLVDNLTYTYNGNQLTKVEDATSNAFGFANGASTTNEYTYDANGNLTKDSNKGIASITYNSLNLPQVVTFSNGNTITYLYAADGKKLRTVHVTNGTATTTDYCGNVIYENGTARLLLTEAGYVDLTDNGHHFYIKDHLGNNRVVADANGNVEENNQYYPFGLNYADAGSNVQPYKYNGKELDTKAGLNWYDYGARHYDAALGRWHVVDPLAEKYLADTPYAYCGSNPVNRIDPTGMDWYENSSGNLFWQEGHKNIDGYTNIGSTATIGWGEDIFFNYYQNMGILGDKPANAIEQIASSPYLMQKAFSESSGLSLQSQQDLFAAIQSRSKAELGREAGLFFVGELAGGFIGKALSWTLGKAVDWIAGKFIGAADNVIAPVVKGYTKSNLKLGQQMHKTYHAGEMGKEFRLPSGRRIDFLDIDNGIIYELKPNNPRAIKQGEKQLQMYLKELQNPATIQKHPRLGGIQWKTILETY